MKHHPCTRTVVTRWRTQSRSIIRGAVALFGCHLGMCAWAQEAPTAGLLYNTQEKHSLTYRCDAVRPAQLTCQFVQTAVRFQSTFSELASVIQQARKAFPTEKPLSDEDCKTYRDMLAVLEGKMVAPKLAALLAFSAVEKRDAISAAKAFGGYCDKPTEENYLAIVRFSHDRDRRTCQVSSNAFIQTFRKADQGARSVWVVEDSPSGPCGAVQLSRFESEESNIGKTVFTHWKYIARKAITNPNAEFLGAKCSGFDEKSYTFDWRSKEHQMTCDYVKFSAF